MGVTFDNKTALSFDRNLDILQIKNSYGYVINSYMMNKLNEDELILIQKGKTGYTDNDCIKYYFINEKDYQNKLQIKSSDVLIISNNDSIYKSNEKIYAKFLDDKSFYDYCSDNMPDKSVVMATNNLFFATFIVRKTGIIDSVQILEKINNRFEKQFRKALDRSKKLWIPAQLGNRKVDVQMNITFRFVTSDKFCPMYDFAQKGKKALINLDYTRALSYFNLALEKIPSDNEILYYKAICEMNLGNKNAACEDLAKVKESEKLHVDDLIEKNCK